MRWMGLLAVALIGCDGTHDGTQVGTETGFGCLVDETEAVDDASATPEGFSEPVQAMVDRVVGAFSGEVRHPDATTSAATFTVTAEGAPVVERRAWKDDGSGMEIGRDPSGCPDAVALPVRVALAVPGQLDLAADAVVRVDPEGVGAVWFGASWGALGGAASPFGFDPDDMAEVELQVQASTRDGGWTGELSFMGESPPSGPGPDASVSATFDDWGELDVTRD